MSLKTDHPHIVKVETICGGEPIIDGLRVAVRHVAVLHRQGDPIPNIAEALDITEAQVFHALSYYHDHQAEIDALIEREEEGHERFLRA